LNETPSLANYEDAVVVNRGVGNFLGELVAEVIL